MPMLGFVRMSPPWTTASSQPSLRPRCDWPVRMRRITVSRASSTLVTPGSIASSASSNSQSSSRRSRLSSSTSLGT